MKVRYSSTAEVASDRVSLPRNFLLVAVVVELLILQFLRHRFIRTATYVGVTTCFLVFTCTCTKADFYGLLKCFSELSLLVPVMTGVWM